MATKYTNYRWVHKVLIMLFLSDIISLSNGYISYQLTSLTLKLKKTGNVFYINLCISFADKAGVNILVKDVLIKLIENRPEDPVAFLADQ